jgi:hypothetical protein
MVAATLIPAALASRPFTVAEAARHGVPASVLRGQRFRAPYHGVRVPAHLPETLETQCAALALLLSGDWAFSHGTGADLCELPLPKKLKGWKPAHVCVGPTTPVPQIGGVKGHEGLDPTRVILRHGLPVIQPMRTWCDLVPELTDLQAVILGDAVLRRWGTLAQLADMVDGRAHQRGVVRMRRLLPVLRERVDSPQETRVRLALRRAGLPEPACGFGIYAEDGGGLLHTADLCWPCVKVLLEYDGEVHRQNRKKWRNDIARKELLEDHGWKVVVATADDLSFREQILIARVAKALRDRGLRW